MSFNLCLCQAHKAGMIFGDDSNFNICRLKVQRQDSRQSSYSKLELERVKDGVNQMTRSAINYLQRILGIEFRILFQFLFQVIKGFLMLCPSSCGLVTIVVSVDGKDGKGVRWTFPFKRSCYPAGSHLKS